MAITATSLPNVNRDILVRVMPFAVFIGFLVLRNVLPLVFGSAVDWRWIYPAKVAATGLTLALFWRHYTELHAEQARRILSAAGLVSVLLGLAVFALWIRLDSGWAVLGGMGKGFTPFDAGHFNYTLVVFRLAGAALLVPLIEELFWRSFLMRWLDHHAFLNLAPMQVGLRALIVSSLVFGFEHNQWLAGMIAGLVYGGLYRRSQNLWLAVVAHATTNLALGIWVLTTGNWQFW